MIVYRAYIRHRRIACRRLHLVGDRDGGGRQRGRGSGGGLLQGGGVHTGALGARHDHKPGSLVVERDAGITGDRAIPECIVAKILSGQPLYSI